MTEKPQAAKAKRQRLHHLDALRASAILLLIPYHGARFIYKERLEITGRGDGVADGGLYEYFVWFVHSWHMPLFFALSGFLAAGALSRGGAAMQVRERLSRLGIPLLVGVVTIIPLLNLIVNYYANLSDGPVDDRRTWELGNIFNWRVQHLWFIDYLLAGTLVLIAIWVLTRRFPQIPAAIARVFELVVGSPLAVPLLALLTAATLSLFEDWQAPPTSESLVPKPALVAYYTTFLSFGWLVSTRPQLIGKIERRWPLYLLIAAAAAPFAFELFDARHRDAGDWGQHALALYANGIVCWSAIIGFWGLFAKLFRERSAIWRYLAGASYWIYLIHLPFLAAAQGGLAQTSVASPIRLVLAVLASIAGSLLTYELFVRRTWLGRFLEGRKKRPTRRDPTPASAAG